MMNGLIVVALLVVLLAGIYVGLTAGVVHRPPAPEHPALDGPLGDIVRVGRLLR